MNQQRVTTAHLQTVTQQRFWEILALLALSFRDTMVGPALMALLFPLWLQRSQPDKTRSNFHCLTVQHEFLLHYSLGFQS